MLSPQEFVSLRRAALERCFSRMNVPQRQAVFCTEGPLLILAGAGSGKTTVLVNRIANLVRFGRGYHSDRLPVGLTPALEEELRRFAAGEGELTPVLTGILAEEPCPAWRILAITFTNKAAGELKERLCRMLGEEGEEVAASTFHAFCAKILRREGENLGYSHHFTIYDTDDSRRLMKSCMKELNIDEKTLGHKAILGEISRAKDALVSPEEYAATYSNGMDIRLRLVARAYPLYQKRLQEADAMDFDDLLCRTVELFTRFPAVLERYQDRFRYLMVDEYQDTNHAQYRLISLLAAKTGNLCVVGDDDQSIYKFRGATIENILGFEEEFKGCRVIRLEQNYRSTKRILEAANQVIAKNTGRKGKTLWTDNAMGDPIRVVTVDNAEEEARYVADTILTGVAGGRRFSEYAVLYRANAQSNALEQALVRSGVPYRVIGGHRFNDTQEVRDAMAYLRLINNPDDEVSLRRIINTPTRGIGATTMDHAGEIAAGTGQGLYRVLEEAENYPALSRAAAKIRAFMDMMEDLRAMASEGCSLRLLYTTMLERTGYRRMWEELGEAEAGRVENLEELSSSIQQYEKNSGEKYADLAGFLEEQALMTDIDNFDADADAAVLMTMHAAKGLEFPVVLLPGFEDGIFPGYQTMFDPTELEEDRRLCYVAITRAREELYITHAQSRMLYGQTTRNPASRFLQDIPPALTEEINKVRSTYDLGGGLGGSRYGAPCNSRGGYAGGGSRYGNTGGSYSRTGRQFPTETWTAKKPLGSVSRISAAAKPAPASNWQVGDRVHHNSFGDGQIMSVTPMAGDTLLVIQFDGAGQKKLMANYAHLTKI